MNIHNGTLSRSDHLHASINPLNSYHQSVDEIASGLKHFNEGIDNRLDDCDSHPIGSMLPDDEEQLLFGIMDDLNLITYPATLDDLEDYDLFGSGGGLELETDPHDSVNKGFTRIGFADSNVDNVMPQTNFQNGVGSFAGKHPSRTLFVRNINSNIDDSELRALFEQFGDIRMLYTACKHRGFVMISYYDIRASRAAMRALQNKLLKRRKLDIHFSIPRIIHLRKMLIKELLWSSTWLHQFPIETLKIYSVLMARSRRTDIAGKRIKLEHSRPGGARRNMMLQMSPELEQDDSCSYLNHVESPLARSPAGNYWCNSPVDHPLQSLSKSPIYGNLSPTKHDCYLEVLPILHSRGVNLTKAGSVNNDQGRWNNRWDNLFSSSSYNNASHKATAFHQPQSFGCVSSFGSMNSHPSHMETLSGSEFLWGSPSSSVWPVNPFSSDEKIHRFLYSQKGPLHQHHHVGSAPSGFFPRSPETSSMGSLAFRGASGNMSAQRNYRETGSPSFKMLSSPRRSKLFAGNGSYAWPIATIASTDDPVEDGRSQQVNSNVNVVDNKKQFQLDLTKIMSGEDLRTTLMIKNIPNKYTRNMLLAAINEKYSGTYDFLYLPLTLRVESQTSHDQNSVLSLFASCVQNKCNVGYAFINMVSPKFIIGLYEAFNGKKWDKFNSEKIASLAYARIQGKTAFLAHFQMSSLMNEDRRCQPIVFDDWNLVICLKHQIQQLLILLPARAHIEADSQLNLWFTT